MAMPLAIRVAMIFATKTLMAVSAPAIAEPTIPAPTSKTSIERQNVGVFTGKVVNGMPLYQLPSITVIGHRKVELAKLKREEQSARSKQVRAKVVAKGPA